MSKDSADDQNKPKEFKDYGDAARDAFRRPDKVLDLPEPKFVQMTDYGDVLRGSASGSAASAPEAGSVQRPGSAADGERGLDALRDNSRAEDRGPRTPTHDSGSGGSRSLTPKRRLEGAMHESSPPGSPLGIDPSLDEEPVSPSKGRRVGDVAAVASLVNVETTSFASGPGVARESELDVESETFASAVDPTENEKLVWGIALLPCIGARAHF